MKIGSVKTPYYVNDPHRLFVLTDFSTAFGPDFSNGFRNRILDIAKDCKVEMAVSIRTPLDLDDSVHGKAMKDFMPDSLMHISRTGGTVDKDGHAEEVIYKVQLVDVKSAKSVWEAIIHFPRGSSLIPLSKRGESLAIELTNDMKNNKIFNSCDVIPPD